MDPITAFLMTLVGQNPGIAPQLDAAGVPPPMGLGGPQPGGMGSLIGGGLSAPQAPPPPVNPAGGMGELIGNTAGGMAAPPPGGNPVPGPASPVNAMGMASLQGVKAPEPIKPIMSGGVVGGVAPPKADVGAISGSNAGSPVAQLLIQALLGGRQQRAPALGDFIKGRGGY